MRAVIGVHHLPPRYNGGAELRALRTARALQARGYDVTVVAVEEVRSGPRAGVGWSDEVYEGLPVRRLRFDLNRVPDPFRFEYDNQWIGEHLHGWLAQQKVDLFHQFSGYLLSASALRAAQALSIPTVLSLTDYWWLCRRINLLRSDGELSTLPIDPARCARCHAEEKRRFRIAGSAAPRLMDAYWSAQADEAERFAARQRFLMQTLHGVDAMISPSHFLRDIHIQAGVPAERIVFSRQGSAYASRDPALALKTESATLRLGYIGQIAPHKGIHVLLEAMQEVHDSRLRLRIFGDSSHFTEYASQIRSMAKQDTRCTLMGSFPRNQLDEVLREIDVLVVPSLWYENSPNVILEAYGHGTPIIVSDLGGMAELVEDGRTGLHFAVGDANSLADALRRFVQDESLRERLREGARSVRLPSVDDEMHELERIYRGAIGRHPQPLEDAVGALRN